MPPVPKPRGKVTAHMAIEPNWACYNWFVTLRRISDIINLELEKKTVILSPI